VTTKSPYAILNVRSDASKEEIKASFRKLAKMYHPDLNPHLSQDKAQENMTDIIQAYEILMKDELIFGSHRMGDNKVALACEMFSLDELRNDSFHHVYSFRVVFDLEGKEQSNGTNIQGDELSVAKSDQQSLSKERIIDLKTHPDDSISDLKRSIQLLHGDSMRLTGRRLDRDNIATGWELVKEVLPHQHPPDIDTDESTTRSSPSPSLTVMSYHLFVHSYDICHGDTIHSIVSKQ